MTTPTADTESLVVFSDHDLIRMALAGQTDCFTALMDRHLGAISRCIGYMLRGNGATEDLTQEVALKAWKFLSAFRAESSFRTWLTRVAVNEVRQFQRRPGESRFQELPDPDMRTSPDESPYDHFARMQRTATVYALIKSLPPRYREVVALRGFEDLSVAEIAERLQCTVPSAKTRLFRGRTMLIAEFQKSQAAAKG